MTAAARAHLEDLLRAKKLDVTLTSAAVWRSLPDDAFASTGLPALDDALGGGLRRGHLSEIVGSRSSGRTSLLCRLAAAATSRGEVMAIVDTHDRFDPESAVAAGVDPGRLLWVRETGNAARALKAVNLILQAGGFGLVVFDLADARGMTLRQFPLTTWMRLARVIEGSQTVALLMTPEHLSRSPGGATITLDGVPAARSVRGGVEDGVPAARSVRGGVEDGVPAARSLRGGVEERPSPAGACWRGASDRSRLLRGIEPRPRVTCNVRRAMC